MNAAALKVFREELVSQMEKESMAPDTIHAVVSKANSAAHAEAGTLLGKAKKFLGLPTLHDRVNKSYWKGAPHAMPGHPNPRPGRIAAYQAPLGKPKLAGIGENLGHAADITGLGVLAVPSVHKLRKIHSKTTTPEEKKDAKYELAGLGILAAPPAMHLAHAAYNRLK